MPPRHRSTHVLTLDVDQLQRDLRILGSFTQAESIGVTRRLGSPVYRAAREWLSDLMVDAGLDVHLDPAANLIGRRKGLQPQRPPIVLGSHTDTVVDGGLYDGALGVLGAIEVARALRRSSVELIRSLEVIDFLSEEVSDFGISAVGSRAMAGALRPDWLLRRDVNGTSLADAIASMGGDPDRVAEAIRPPGTIAAYLELHIEQGSRLQHDNVQIGIVSGIVAIHRYCGVITGRPDHPGTTSMLERRDSLTGASEIVLLIEQVCRAAGYPVVGTVGRLTIHPNTANVIPGRVEMIFELRAPDETLLAALAEVILSEANRTAMARGLTWSCEPSGAVQSARSSPCVMEAMEQAVAARGYRSVLMHSGAGHDANHLAAVGPIGMLFVPCREGRSHSPEEYCAPGDFMPGVDVLAHAVAELDWRLAVS